MFTKVAGNHQSGDFQCLQKATPLTGLRHWISNNCQKCFENALSDSRLRRDVDHTAHTAEAAGWSSSDFKSKLRCLKPKPGDQQFTLTTESKESPLHERTWEGYWKAWMRSLYIQYKKKMMGRFFFCWKQLSKWMWASSETQLPSKPDIMAVQKNITWSRAIFRLAHIPRVLFMQQ